MASTSRIVFTAVTTDGDKSFSYNYADEDATQADVRSLASALVTNGSLFENVPTEIKAAKIITTTTSEYNLG